MSKLSYKVSYYVLYAIFAAIVVVLALFYFGGEMSTPLVAEMANPAYTEALLFLMYGLVGLAIVATVIAFIAQFISTLKDNPMRALKSLLGLILVVVLLVVTYSIGDPTPLNITGYDGTENVPFWLKLTDMFLYSLYLFWLCSEVALKRHCLNQSEVKYLIK